MTALHFLKKAGFKYHILKNSSPNTINPIFYYTDEELPHLPKLCPFC